jgi:putative hydrolase of the HAD superfamily
VRRGAPSWAGSPWPERQSLHRAYDETRRARGVGAFGSAEGDMSAIVSAAGVAPDAPLIDELTQLERSFLADGGITLYEDSVEVAAELRARGTRTALVSNCSHSTIPVVAGLGLAEVLDVLVLSVTAGGARDRHPPDPPAELEPRRGHRVGPQRASRHHGPPRAARLSRVSGRSHCPGR